jgi:hypothetical protein
MLIVGGFTSEKLLEKNIMHIQKISSECQDSKLQLSSSYSSDYQSQFSTSEHRTTALYNLLSTSNLTALVVGTAGGEIRLH